METKKTGIADKVYCRMFGHDFSYSADHHCLRCGKDWGTWFIEQRFSADLKSLQKTPLTRLAALKKNARGNQKG